MADYDFYYKYRSEIFGVIEKLDKKYKVESLQNRKTYNIESNWLQEEHEKGNIEFSYKGDFT